MRVVVTGASGDFGSCIIREILGRGQDVIGTSRRPHPVPSPRYRHVCADIRDVDTLTDAMAGVDAVVHLAWTTHPLHDPDATRAIDVGGTRAVLEAMQRSGVGRLVCASSVMAYGANADNPPFLTEADPLRPGTANLYSAHKAEIEGIIGAAPVSALLARPTLVMGRNSTAAREGFATPIIVGMKGALNTLQLVHPDDVARFFADALTHPEWAGPVNLAAPGTITMREIAEVLGKCYMEFNPQAAQAVLGFLWNHN